MNLPSVFFKLLIVFFLIAPVIGIAESLNDQEINQIQHVLKNYRAAWLEGNEEKVLATLSDEILLFVPGNGGRISGKAAVKEFWFPTSDISYPIRAYKVSDQEIFGSGEIATATGKSELTWETVESGTVTDSQTSYSDYMTVFRNEEGHWRIYRQMYQMRNKEMATE